MGMLFGFVTMNDEGHYRPFFCQVPAFEEAFDVLSSVVANGDLVVSVDLLDLQTGQRTTLPPEAFDGEPIRPHIKQLEEEWQALLATPVNLKPGHHQLLAGFSGRLQETYQGRIDWLRLAITQTNARIEELPHEAYWESCHVRLELQVSLYYQQLERAQTEQRRVCDRFASY